LLRPKRRLEAREACTGELGMSLCLWPCSARFLPYDGDPAGRVKLQQTHPRTRRETIGALDGVCPTTQAQG